MKRIKFKNYGPPGLSEQILEQLQDNIEEETEPLKENILWEGDTNNVDEINLNSKIMDYLKLKIYFQDNNAQKSSVEIDNSSKLNEIHVNLSSFCNEGQWFNVKIKCITLSNNKVFSTGYATYEFSTNQIVYSNHIYITKITGYK